MRDARAFRDRWEILKHEEVRPEAVENPVQVGVDDEAPLSVSLTDLVEKEKAEAYMEWQFGIATAMETFVGRDAVVSTLLREPVPQEPSALRFISIFRFARRRDAVAWRGSAERSEWLAKLAALGIDDDRGGRAVDHPQALQSQDLVPVFDLPPADGRAGQRLRVCVLVWAQVYALCEVFAVLMPIIFGAAWHDMPFHLQLAVGTAAMSVVIEYVTMRAATTAARRVGFLRS